MSIEFYDPSEVDFEQTLLTEIEVREWENVVKNLVVEGRERFHLFTNSYDGRMKVVGK